jgi:hypothetical protein
VGIETRVTDGAVLARESSTGRFLPTEAVSPHIAARRDQVATLLLYSEKTYDEIGAKLGWKKATIAKDAVALGLERQRPGPRPKYPIPEPRKCANPDCTKVVAPEPNVAARGYGNFCSIPCARRAAPGRVRARARELRTEWRRRADEEIARLNNAGYRTSRQLAAEKKVVESTVSQWIARGLLRAERRMIEGEPHQLISREEFDRFNVEEWPRICRRMGPSFPANWGGERRRMWSRRLRAATVGKLGGQKRRYDDEHARKVRATKAAYPTWGPITIARVVSRATGRPITPKQVRGILSRPPG